MLIELGCCSGLETIATADRRDFQVQSRMLRVAALIHYFEIRLVAGHDAYQYVRLVVFAKVAAETALSVANRFHVSSYGRWGMLIAFRDNLNMSFILCKLRPNEAQISATF
jgi:hypothetical protein